MQVVAVPIISTFSIKRGACLALLPLGQPAEDLPEPEPTYDIRKLLIKEKLARQNLTAYGFQTYD